jgi:hypothetical protein
MERIADANVYRILGVTLHITINTVVTIIIIISNNGFCVLTAVTVKTTVLWVL